MTEACVLYMMNDLKRDKKVNGGNVRSSAELSSPVLRDHMLENGNPRVENVVKLPLSPIGIPITRTRRRLVIISSAVQAIRVIQVIGIVARIRGAHIAPLLASNGIEVGVVRWTASCKECLRGHHRAFAHLIGADIAACVDRIGHRGIGCPIDCRVDVRGLPAAIVEPSTEELEAQDAKYCEEKQPEYCYVFEHRQGVNNSRHNQAQSLNLGDESERSQNTDGSESSVISY